MPSSSFSFAKSLGCKSKSFQRVPLVDRFELDPYQRWHKYNAFPRTLLLHFLLVILVTAQAILTAQTSSNFSANIHNDIVTWFLPPDYVNNLVGNSLTFPGDEIFLHTTDELNTTLFSIFTTYFSLNVDNNPLPPDHSDGSSTQVLGTYGSPEYIDIYTSGKSTLIRPPSLTFSLSYNGEYHSTPPSSVSSNSLLNTTLPLTDVRPLQETVVFQTLDDFYAWTIRAFPSTDDLSHFAHSLLQLNADIQFRVYNFDADGITSNVCVLWDVGFVFDISARGTILVSIDDDFDTCDNGWRIDNQQGISPILICSAFLLLSAVIQQILTVRECTRTVRLMLWSNDYCESVRYQIRKDRQRRYKVAVTTGSTPDTMNQGNTAVNGNDNTLRHPTIPPFSQVSRSSMSSIGIDEANERNNNFSKSMPLSGSSNTVTDTPPTVPIEGNDKTVTEDDLRIPLVQLGFLPFFRILCTCSCYRVRDEETIFDDDDVDVDDDDAINNYDRGLPLTGTATSRRNTFSAYPSLSPSVSRTMTTGQFSVSSVSTSSSSNNTETTTATTATTTVSPTGTRSISFSSSLRTGPTNNTAHPYLERNRSASSVGEPVPRLQSMAQSSAIASHDKDKDTNTSTTNAHRRRQSTVSTFPSSTPAPPLQSSPSSSTPDGLRLHPTVPFISSSPSLSGGDDGGRNRSPSFLPRGQPLSQNEYAVRLAHTFIDTSFDPRQGPILGLNRIQRRHRLEIAIQQFRKYAQVVNGTHIMELFSPWLVVSFIGETLNIIYAIYCIYYGEISVPVEIDVLLGLGAALEWTVIVKYVRHYGHLSIFERAVDRALPSVIRNLVATVPVFAAFVVFQCMVNGNLTERFDGLEWSSIALFAVANGDVVRETFQVTLQYQPNIPMQWISQIVLYAYVIIVIYALLKTTTAITEEAFLLTRPSPGMLHDHDHDHGTNDNDTPKAKNTNENERNSSLFDTKSVSSRSSSSSSTTIPDDIKNTTYYLQEEIRNLLLAMQEVYDAGGSISALVKEAVATVPYHAKYWLFSNHHHHATNDGKEEDDSTDDNGTNVPEIETNIQEYIDAHPGASITKVPNYHNHHPQDTMIDEDDTMKVRLLGNTVNASSNETIVTTEQQLRSIQSIRLNRSKSSNRLVRPTKPRPSTLFQDVGQWIRYGVSTVLFGISENSDEDIIGQPNEFALYDQAEKVNHDTRYGTVGRS